MGKLALFDLDNTLLDREAAFSKWARGFATEFELPQGSRAVIGQLDEDGSIPREDFFAAIRQAFGIAATIEELVSRYYLEYPDCFTVDGNTVTSLRNLRSQGWKVGVVTNGPPSQMRKLESTGLVDEVDAICISETVGSWKPDPAIFEEAARRCGLPLRGWMVGDSAPADIVGGRQCGLRTIWMARGRAWDPSELPPDEMVATIPQAVDLILAGSRPTGSSTAAPRRSTT
jgi:putative hydrolase of the HAD superfamily